MVLKIVFILSLLVLVAVATLYVLIFVKGKKRVRIAFDEEYEKIRAKEWGDRKIETFRRKIIGRIPIES